MKYYVLNIEIRDGENEYLTQSPYQATTEMRAIVTAYHDYGVKKINRAEKWQEGENDYRLYRVRVSQEINREEFDVIKKYIY